MFIYQLGCSKIKLSAESFVFIFAFGSLIKSHTIRQQYLLQLSFDQA